MATNGNVKCRIVSCYGLKNADIKGLSDPYVIVSLDGKRITKTVTIDDNLSPIWNHDFMFHIRGDTFKGIEITFQVFDEDRFSKDDFLGEIRLDLQDLIDGKITNKTFVLQPRKLRPDKVQGFITVEFQPFDTNAAPTSGASQWHMQNGRMMPGS
mmetsp:Transcript_12778/g.21894  ORF Transcript_12778/g.21894 Transcript_12778/m.21894 type:complete len:155 (-) Transcript_12778:38-502(-)